MNGLKKPKERLIKLGLENSLARKVCSFVTCLSPTSPTGEWGNTFPFFVVGEVMWFLLRLDYTACGTHCIT